MSLKHAHSWLIDCEVLILGFVLVFLWGCDSSSSAEQSTEIDSPRSIQVDTNVKKQTGSETPTSRSDTAIRRLKNMGKATYHQQCSSCHGPNLKGRPPVYPSLNELPSKRSRRFVKNRIRNGKGVMPSFSHLADGKIASLIIYLMGPASDTEPTNQVKSDTAPGTRINSDDRADTAAMGDTDPGDSPTVTPGENRDRHPGHRKRRRRRHRHRGPSGG